jgi:hypothetical protein
MLLSKLEEMVWPRTDTSRLGGLFRNLGIVEGQPAWESFVSAIAGDPAMVRAITTLITVAPELFGADDAKEVAKRRG